MFAFLVACSLVSTVIGLLFYEDALFPAVVFVLLARLAQADEQHRAYLSALHGEELEQHVRPPSSRETERRWQETLKERGLKD